jgi:hypothetical protein
LGFKGTEEVEEPKYFLNWNRQAQTLTIADRCRADADHFVFVKQRSSRVS